MSNPPKIGTLGVAVSSLWKEQNTCESGPNPKESQVNIYLKLWSLSFLVQRTNSCIPLPAGEEDKPEIPCLALRDNCCSLLVLSLCGHCRELWLHLTDPRASSRIAASGQCTVSAFLSSREINWCQFPSFQNSLVVQPGEFAFQNSFIPCMFLFLISNWAVLIYIVLKCLDVEKIWRGSEQSSQETGSHRCTSSGWQWAGCKESVVLTVSSEVEELSAASCA